MKIFNLVKILLTLSLIVNINMSQARDEHFLNVSFDITRELYKEINQEFEQYWYNKTKKRVKIRQSHGGSGKQARSVIEGLRADIVTLAIGYDIEAIVNKGLINPKQLKKHNSPYSSTVIFLVRKDNPLNIKDWDDLIKPGINVIMPNPKTSGGARWNYLAAYAYAANKYKNDNKQINEFMQKLFNNVPFFDHSARASTITFIRKNMGDVLITWESEAFLMLDNFVKDKFTIVIPSYSIKAELPAIIVDKVADENNNREIAEAYIKFLYTDKVQRIFAKYYFRPNSAKIITEFREKMPKIELITIKELGLWQEIHAKHFADGALFDQLYSIRYE